MAGRDLRALFSTNDRGLQAVEAFTNRQLQWELVAAALAEHLRRITEAGFEVEDLERPRHNVMVFHGVGGIGKTTLSRKLEAALAGADQRPAQWGEPAWSGERILPVRIDLARSAGTSFEDVVLTIRAALAELGRPLPAFDIALRRYWETQHPGESLEEYLRRGGLAGRFGKAMPQQMQSALADVAQALLLPGTVGTAAGALVGSLTGALRERRQTVRALAGCARLAELLEAEPDLEALSFYPHLLAWELAQLPKDKRVLPVILLDTFEDVGDRTHRDLERLIQRVVWLMPNCFFVVTGRSRLQWADAALQGQLDYTGPTAWPGLALPAAVPAARAARPPHGHGRQVLIGDFSPEDCDDHLARRLTRDGAPLISEEIRRVITDRSHGLPLYLDLSVMRFLEIRRTGRTPQPADFDHDFPALIARTLSDLTADERHVLRSVALLDAFDLSLATAAAGLPHEAPALRLIERPFVRENVFGLWPYHLHGLIRSTVRSADDQADDRWSARDWEQAAQRALTALGEQWNARAGRDRMLLVGCLRQGLALARDFRLDLGWLAEAAWAYVSDSVWEPIAPLSRADGGMTSPADALVELLATLARRQHEHRTVTVSRLTSVSGSGLLPADLHEMAVYYLAKAHRDLGDSAASRRGMQFVAGGGGRLAPAARRGLAHLARLAGDFPTAYATARTLGWTGRQHRVEGDILWPHGDMNRAASAYEAARDQAEQHGVAGERATSQAHRALALAFTHPTVADDELHLAEQLLTGLDLRATSLTVRVAALVRDAGALSDLEVARDLRAEIRDTGITAAEAVLELALAFHHAVQGEEDKVRTVIDRLRDLARTGDYAHYADIAHYMADLHLPDASTAHWLDGPEEVRARWRQLVQTRRDRIERAG
ncbi:ATP/GTP-binding protein [Streptomyces chryseus]|uniref:ATP/GTP-binding protein n=1 Tax=Streptomyces chryseus TaxID=68186 RepID=UPI00110F96DD|nr:ATP/GTP-binding protein [Streptomyces chryseus]GGX29512.1 ATP/GTP-binding protein [Streptomyces chryseus]